MPEAAAAVSVSQRCRSISKPPCLGADEVGPPCTQLSNTKVCAQIQLLLTPRARSQCKFCHCVLPRQFLKNLRAGWHILIFSTFYPFPCWKQSSFVLFFSDALHGYWYSNFKPQQHIMMPGSLNFYCLSRTLKIKHGKPAALLSANKCPEFASRGSELFILQHLLLTEENYLHLVLECKM